MLCLLLQNGNNRLVTSFPDWIAIYIEFLENIEIEFDSNFADFRD